MFVPGPPSLWQTEARAMPATQPALGSGKHACEVLVIGAGITGCAAAAALADRGADVLTIDAHGPGSCASGRNAGFLLLTNAVEYPALRRRLGPTGARAYLALARRNHALVRERHADRCDYRRTGSLMLAMADDARELAMLAEAARLLAEDGVAAEHGPCTQGGLTGFGGQIFVAEDAQIQPAGLLLSMAAPLRRLALATVVDLDLDLGRARTVDGGEIAFREVVVAANAYAGALLPDLQPRIVCNRGQVLATSPVARVLEPVAYAGWGYDYFRQLENGVVILGGRRHLHVDAERTTDGSPTTAVQQALEAYLDAHLPFARGAAITHRWAGIMGFSPTGLPLLERREGASSHATVIAGFTGHGMGLGAACGELVAAMIAATPTAEQRGWIDLLATA